MTLNAYPQPISNDKHNHKVILVVEDDEDQLRHLEVMLKVRGYNVATALSAQAALKIVNELHVDLVVSDIMMPEMNGQELVCALRATRGHSGLPVIAISAGYVLCEEDLVSSGIDKFIKKQDVAAQLLMSIEHLVNNQKLNSDLLLQICDRYLK